jgi:hypothetical protein
MKKKQKSIRYRIQCAKCRQTDQTGYQELMLTDTTGNRTARATLCPACLQMFWLVYTGFIQTRPSEKPVYIKPPKGFRAAFGYHQQRHVEAMAELEKEIVWHRQGIRYLRDMPSELSAPHPHP